MKRLSSLTTEEVKAELSIAGNPEKVGKMFDEMQKTLSEVDMSNAAELQNIGFVLDRLKAEVKLYLRMLEKKTGQKY